MRGASIGRTVGAASLAFGITDILFGKVFGRGIGAGEAEGGTLFRSVGAREVVTGVIGLAFPSSPIPVWTRVAADLTDLAALVPIVARPNPKRTMALFALGTVFAVAVIDLIAVRALSSKAVDSRQAKRE